MGRMHIVKSFCGRFAFPRAISFIIPLAMFGCHQRDPAIVQAPEDMIEFRVGSPFSSHMVLQRDVTVPIWGVDVPGTAVQIKSGHQVWRATADDDGKWRADIGPFEVGGPFTLHIKGSKTIVLDDVLSGEVWLASGQSNMEWPLSASSDGAGEVSAANYPSIRLLTVPHNGQQELVDFVDNAGWAVCTPKSAADFSAVAYYFAREIHEAHDVPVGIIANAWGGATMETYTSLASLAADPLLAWNVEEFKKYGDELESPAAREFEQRFKKWNADTGDKGYYEDSGDDGVSLGFASEDFDVSGWRTLSIPETIESELGAIDGAIWFRRTVDIHPDWAGKELVLSLAVIDGADAAWVNGVEVGRTGSDTPGFWAANRQYRIPPGTLHSGANTIAVRVFEQSWNGAIFFRPQLMSIGPSQAGTPIPLTGEWKYFVTKELTPRPESPLREAKDVPSMCYNGMVHPIAPFRFRGVIWYQGESNVSRAERYRRLTGVMLADWRREFETPKLPFLYVQLAGFRGKPGWVELMNSQLHCLDIPFVGMASAADLGTEDDIHPRNKGDVGRRLALVARALVYGEQVEYSGPVLSSGIVEGKVISLSFDHIGQELVSRSGGNDVDGFEIAGEDGIYHAATARITGDIIAVMSLRVEKPTAIRYAWKDFTVHDLYNADGLPASPFRTPVPVKQFLTEAFRP